MSGLMESYNNFFERNEDPRTSKWFMSGGIGPLLIVLVTYVYFSVSAGPRYMRDKKPYSLKNVLIVYNAVQVLLSLHMFWEGLNAGWLQYYNYKCQPVDTSRSVIAMRMATAVWVYYMAKISELLDTVFFVLRKKNKQISFLHVYHHTLMPFCGFIGVKFFPGGHATLLGVINSFIHIIMYAYYLMAALGPQYQKYLWWKKYLTVMQMIQFVIVLIHNLIPLLFVECGYPKPIAFLLCLNASIFLYLFGSFYVKSYTQTRKTSRIENGKVLNERDSSEIEEKGKLLGNGVTSQKLHRL